LAKSRYLKARFLSIYADYLNPEPSKGKRISRGQTQIAELIT